jgi:hypothetical protein
MDDDLLASNAAWRSIPLCCRYCLVRFETLPVQTVKDGVASSARVLWAFGVLSDGESEVLGAWPVQESATTGWAEVFDDLRLRGVGCIGSVASSEPTMDTAALRSAYPSAVSLGAPPAARPVSPIRPAVSRRTGAAGPQCRPPVRMSLHQQIVLASEGAARRLQSRVTLAVARHGPFSNLEAARSFVIGDLRRAERKLVPFRPGVRALVDSRSRHHLPESVG